jgi:hypothetical protein
VFNLRAAPYHVRDAFRGTAFASAREAGMGRAGQLDRTDGVMAEPRLQAIEARIWSLLEPYRSELEAATIYGMPSLRWPDARAHDYFASVRSGKSYVSLYLLVADAYPEALEETPPALLKRRSGKAAFTFGTLDDDMANALEALLARLYVRYRADHAR